MTTRDKNTKTHLTVILGVILIISMLLNGWVFLFSKTPWAPLIDYPPQTVTLVHETVTVHRSSGDIVIDSAVLKWDGVSPLVVPVQAHKCSTATSEFDIDSKRYYDFTSPVVETIPDPANIHGKRQPGCLDASYQNALPDFVTSRVKKLLTKNTPVELRLRGVETPIDSHGDRGLSQQWVTDTFAVLLVDET